MRSIFTANRTGLVTGASAGIGLEMARSLASKLDSLTLGRLISDMRLEIPKDFYRTADPPFGI